MATALWPPRGMMTSAYRLLGSTNSRCIGFTVPRYCSITDSIVRPRSATSRRNRRMNRVSSSVSTNTLMSIRSRNAASV